MVSNSQSQNNNLASCASEKTIKVSVVMPVYNVEKYIGECLDSVISQTLDDIEIIAIDDGSRDSSGRILDDYAKKDSRIQVIHKRNGGVSAARNDGLEICTGEYIYIMDSDDYLESSALEEMYKNAIVTGADVVIGDHISFDEKGSQILHHLFKNEFITDDRETILQLQNMVLHPGYSPLLSNTNPGLGIGPPWTKLVRKNIIDDHKLRFEPYVKGIFDDCLFSMHVFEYAKKVSYIMTCGYHYRILQTSLTHRFNAERLEINKRVFDKIDEFKIKYNKGIDFEQAYYARVIAYFLTTCSTYLLHKQYNGTLRKNYKEFLAIVNKVPYCTAIKQVDISKLSKLQKCFVVLSRLHLNWLIWIACQVRKVLK